MDLHPFWQLCLFRFRAMFREPAILFWVFAFPILISLALGLAFRRTEGPRLAVAVADGPDADAVAAYLDRAEGLTASRVRLAEGEERLRRGRAALVLVPGAEPRFVTDPTQPDSRMARLLARDALERRAGRPDRLQVSEQRVTAPGSRYIDFLIPGLLGMAIMSSGVWGIGWAIVQMRMGKLLKQLVATPMRRSHFLLSFVVSRTTLAIVELGFFVAFARYLFDVRVFGSYVALTAFALLGSLSFAGFSLLVAARAQSSEVASGLMNALTMPMMGLSGVFFSASHFPAWMQPAVKALPLTALNDGLRAIMADGASLISLGPEIANLVLWGVLPFLLALRIFRWT